MLYPELEAVSPIPNSISTTGRLGIYLCGLPVPRGILSTGWTRVTNKPWRHSEVR